MRMIAATLCLASGCSWLFQEHLASDRKPNTEPRCSTAPGWWAADILIAILDATIVAGVADAASQPGAAKPDNTIVAGLVIEGVLHAASGITGNRWASSCADERVAWDSGHAAPLPTADEERVRDEAVRRTGLANYCFTYRVMDTGEDRKTCKQFREICVQEHDRLARDNKIAQLTECLEILPNVTIPVQPPAPTEQCFEYDVVESSERKTMCKPTVDECVAKRDEVVADKTFTAVKPCKGR